MHKELKKIFDNYIYILLFFSIWFCIDTNFNNILILKKSISINNFFLSLRACLPYLIFFVFIVNLLLNKNKISILTKNKSLNIMLIILFIYFLSHIPGLIITENSIINSYYVLVAIIAIFCAAITYNSGKNLEKTYYKFSIIILIPIVAVYGYLSWEWILKTQNLNMYGTFPHVFADVQVFSSNVIRSSGLARSTMIITFPLFLLLILERYNLLYFFIYLILSSIIYLTQSRIVVLFFISFSFFSIVYFCWNNSLIHKLKKILILILLPILFFNSIIILKEELRTGFIRNFLNQKLGTDLNTEIGKNFFIDKDYSVEFNLEEQIKNPKTTIGSEGGMIRRFDPETFTSNRYGYWKKIINNSKQPLIGYGSLGDRFLINLNCGNTLIYSYVSGGIIATILMLLLIIRYTYLSFYIIFYKKINLTKENLILISSIFTIAFLFLRGVAEVGIGVFSIDFLIFLSCAMVCESFMDEKINKNTIIKEKVIANN